MAGTKTYSLPSSKKSPATLAHALTAPEFTLLGSLWAAMGLGRSPYTRRIITVSLHSCLSAVVVIAYELHI
jgi:hypothetical protein